MLLCVLGVKAQDYSLYFGGKGSADFYSTIDNGVSADVVATATYKGGSNASVCPPAGVTTAYRTGSVGTVEFTVNSSSVQDLVFTGMSSGSATRTLSGVSVNGSDITSSVTISGSINGNSSCSSVTVFGIDAAAGSTIILTFNNNVQLNYLTITPMEDQSEKYALSITSANGTVAATNNLTGATISDLSSISENTVVVLTATPSRGYEFASWSGDIIGTANPATVEMTAAKSVTANYTALTERAVGLSTSGCEGVSAAISGANEDGKLFDGDVITLTATESDVCKFVKWSDESTVNPRPYTVNGDASLTAIFEADITAPSLDSASPSGTVTLAPNATTDSQTVTLTFDEDVVVEDASLILVNGAAATSPVATGNKITFDVDVTAGETYAITLGAGAIADAAGNANAVEIAATSFTVEACESLALASLPYTWDKESLPCWITGNVGYNGTYDGSDATCSGSKVIRINNANGTADFNLPSCGTFSVTVSATGGRTFNLLVNGAQVATTGAISSKICKEMTYDVNSCDPVVITVENIGGGGATISDFSITKACASLTIDSSVANGTITVSPESATGYYLNGTEITLTATANEGYVFEAWTGHALVAEGFSAFSSNATQETTTITMDGEDKTVGATFTTVLSIDNSTASKAVASVKLYDVTGVEVGSDAKGVVIVKTTYEDGSVETTKQLVK